MAAQQDPKIVFSAVVSVDYADRSSAQLILERACRTAGGDPKKHHWVFVRRADGEVWEDPEGARSLGWERRGVLVRLARTPSPSSTTIC